ncbi:a0636acf-136d-4261-b13d-06c584d5e938 [Sclerotinia trifoliorum]|uniref:A0636acf-136d-4261-b13d-06c584d5e938 n=1 Tax=Sclerotinia trifoliorum TaxID=28548 RepID=A0A8H2VLU0_9HELO|nr:a0636acf-136d-4261-b13d-06c584d5e938 [Sclerotinia trifoliorum]
MLWRGRGGLFMLWLRLGWMGEGWRVYEGWGEVVGGEGEGGRGEEREVIENGREGGEWETGNWVSDIISYLQAFYHGLPVKQMDPSNLHFTPWEDTTPNPYKTRSSPKKKKPTTISLRTSNSKTRIRYRATPSAPFSHQLNLSDVLDSAIDILPPDAYALLMLVNHDLYEDDDDEFICGRAYGGSRVAVVSTARYNPVLDEMQGIERIHGWPGSHCAEYIDKVCGKVNPKTNTKTNTKTRKRKRTHDDKNLTYALNPSPLHHALTQQTSLPPLSSSPLPPTTLQTLHLSRICRIASHELGHCFGIAHCVYYACSMQGSASIIEDARQPPYLCPVDLQKWLRRLGDVRGGMRL